MSQTYFQLGGRSSQLRWGQAWWDDNGNAKIVSDSSLLKQRNGNIGLILGLKSTGTSHLLLTKDDAYNITLSSPGKLHLPQPGSANRVHEFESLSPIEFENLVQLTSKLKTLRKAESSQANRNDIEVQLDLYRGAFEHGRLLYHVLNNTIDPRKYGVEDVSWAQKTRIASFVFNVKGVDSRGTEERRLKPDVLDIGFCQGTLPAIFPVHSTAKHILNRQNKLLGKKGAKKKSFEYGTSEELMSGEFRRRIKEMFKGYEGAKSENPTILLVCKEEETLNFLRNHDVDTSGWRSGIRDLIMSEDIPGSPLNRTHGSPSREHRRYSNSRELSSFPNQHEHRRRSRSRSPDRRGSNNWGQRGHSRSNSSSTSRYDTHGFTNSSFASPKGYAPIYVLDVYKLYTTLMRMSVHDVADMASSQFFKLTSDKDWCAGNEAALLIDIWREMVSSLPIDEQRALRTESLHGGPTSSTSAPASDPAPELESEPYVYNSDDERDPNDIIVKPQAQIQAEAQKKAMEDDPYAFDESDHSSDGD